jgi:hypothetical protein
MTEHLELTVKPRDHFLKAAEKELVAFEGKEREFRKQLKRERAAELPMPLIKQELLRN